MTAHDFTQCQCALLGPDEVVVHEAHGAVAQLAQLPHLGIDTLDTAHGHGWLAAVHAAVLNLAGKGERAGHAVDAMIGTVARGHSRGVGLTLELGVVVVASLQVVTCRQRQCVQVLDERAAGVVGHLAVASPRDTLNRCPVAATVQRVDKLAHGELGLATHHYDAVVSQAATAEVGGSGPHEHHMAVGPVLEHEPDGFKVVVNREVDGPHQVDVARVVVQPALKVVPPALVIDKVAASHLVQPALLDHSHHGQFVGVGRQIHDMGAACRALGRPLAYKYRWCDKR